MEIQIHWKTVFVYALFVGWEMEAISIRFFAFNLPGNTGWVPFALGATFDCWANFRFSCDVLDVWHCPSAAKCDVIHESIGLFKIFSVLRIWNILEREILSLKTNMHVVLVVLAFNFWDIGHCGRLFSLQATFGIMSWRKNKAFAGWGCQLMKYIQCRTVITRSIFTKVLTTDFP